MSEEVAVLEAPAPELEPTAVAPEPVIETEPARTYTQEEFDALAAKQRHVYEKNLAREQRKWEREQTQRQSEQQTLTEPATEPNAVLQKAEELVAAREAAKQQSQVLESYHEREEEARGKYDDFEQVAYNPKLTITDVMAETIQSSDVGPEIAYYLGSNPKDAGRISRLPALAQAKEIGKIEAKLASDPPVRRTTSAPAPISPVTARTSGSPAYDTTDPRSIKTMSASEWIEADRARQVKKAQAQANR
jgi:hypothetical protein